MAMGDQSETVLCPFIAEEQIIITSDNVDSLSLSNYSRSIGTVVKVNCLSNTHVLSGVTDTLTLVCGSDGHWSEDVPRCVYRRLVTKDRDLNQTTTVALTSATYSYEMLPYIVALSILGIACLLFIILLSYALLRRRRQNVDGCSTILEGSRSSNETADIQTEFWVEMTGSRSFQCHELAQSRDSMVDIVKYTHLHPDWSGY